MVSFCGIVRRATAVVLAIATMFLLAFTWYISPRYFESSVPYWSHQQPAIPATPLLITTTQGGAAPPQPPVGASLLISQSAQDSGGQTCGLSVTNQSARPALYVDLNTGVMSLAGFVINANTGGIMPDTRPLLLDGTSMHMALGDAIRIQTARKTDQLGIRSDASGLLIIDAAANTSAIVMSTTGVGIGGSPCPGKMLCVYGTMVASGRVLSMSDQRTKSGVRPLPRVSLGETGVYSFEYTYAEGDPRLGFMVDEVPALCTRGGAVSLDCMVAYWWTGISPG